MLPPGLAALVDQLLQILAPCPSSYEKRIGCIDNDKVVHPQTGDDTFGERNNDPAHDLFVHHCICINVLRAEEEKNDR